MSCSLFSDIAYIVLTVISLRAADVADVGFRREWISFWGLSSLASTLRCDLSLLVSHRAFRRNSEREFVTQPAFPIQL